LAGEKTEKATPKRRRDERKKGNIFLSKDAVSVATLFGSTVMIRVLFVSMVAAIYQIFYYCFSRAAALSHGTEPGFDEIMHECMVVFAKTALPLLLTTALVAAIATVAQTRMLAAPQLLKPKFSRINPLQGFKRLFSLRSLVEALKGIIKISVLLYLIYTCIKSSIETSANYLDMDITTACASLFKAIFSMMLKVGVAFLVLAAVDFMYQKWDYERQIKMSKQEIKEEYKQTEGDPQVKGRIKELQRRMAQSRMMSKVPEADVVIRNPTHFAVALRYTPHVDKAPVVLAKGMDALALKIVEVAEANSVHCIENVPLARGLYANTELDQEIPPEFYNAVAEVLVFLYKLDNKH